MNLNLTEAQFAELLELVHIGGYVRNAVREQEDDYNPTRDEALEDFLYKVALEHKILGIELDKEIGYIGPTNQKEGHLHAIIEQYDEEQFWFELGRLLGQRDLRRTLTASEEDESEQSGWLPERVHELYEKYDEEFEGYGIERLEVNTAAPIPDVRDLLE